MTKQPSHVAHARTIKKGASTGRRRKRAPVVHEEVYARLRRAIIDGQLEPGRALSVRTLAAQFSVSAMPAREAIRRSGADPVEFDHAIFGNVMQTSADALYGARHVALKAGLKIQTPAVTVNRSVRS